MWATFETLGPYQMGFDTGSPPKKTILRLLYVRSPSTGWRRCSSAVHLVDSDFMVVHDRYPNVPWESGRLLT